MLRRSFSSALWPLISALWPLPSALWPLPVFLLTTAAAMGQSADSTTDVSNSEGSDWHPLRLGPFDFHPRLTTRATYDDNVFISSAGKQSDVYFSLEPGLRIVGGDKLAIFDAIQSGSGIMSLSPGNYVSGSPEGWPGRLAIIDYAPTFNWFSRYTQNNSLDHAVEASLLWPLSRLILGASQGYQLRKASIIEAGQRSQYDVISSALMAGYWFSEKYSGELNLSRDSTSYEQGRGLFGYTSWRDENWFNYQMTPLVGLGAGVTLGYDQTPTTGDQTFEQFQLRARYKLAEKVSVYASGGAELRQYEAREQAINSIFNAGASYQPFGRTSLNLSASRRNYASIYGGLNNIATSFTLGVSQGIGDRYTLGLNGGYSNYEYQSNTANATTNLEGDGINAGATFTLRILRRLRGSAFYNFRTFKYNTGLDYDDNQVGVQLTLNY